MSITKTAEEFLTACETGKGWSVCSAYCTPGATFSAQAEPLAEVSTVEQYTNWMQGMLTVLTDGTYDVKSLATDAERNNVNIYAVFTGTHLAGGPVPPTGRPRRPTMFTFYSSRVTRSPIHEDLELRLCAEGTRLGLISSNIHNKRAVRGPDP
jgi:hypothetical protein